MNLNRDVVADKLLTRLTTHCRRHNISLPMIHGLAGLMADDVVELTNPPLTPAEPQRRKAMDEFHTRKDLKRLGFIVG